MNKTIKEREEFTEEEMQKAHSESGECQSCGWHAGFYEHDYDRTERKDFPNEYWDICRNSDFEDTSDHRGCYIYPVKSNSTKP